MAAANSNLLTRPMDIGPKTPEVSTAAGRRVNQSPRVMYLAICRSSANLAAVPFSVAEVMMLAAENGSVQVASQIKHLLLSNGNMVIPSGHFPSPYV